ncbi:MAG: hypothetical protein HFJ46_05170 [Clostridia bacterium]|nr:hypothetical protein [Clostridia bacterium]
MEKIKEIFKNKKIENLIFILILLFITLIVINKILKGNENEKRDFSNEIGVELASNEKTEERSLEKKLEIILKKIEGVSDVSVLITYSESSSIIPIYNESENKSKTEEKDGSGGVRTTETTDSKKDVITDASSLVITEKTVMPKIEGAIIIAKGAKNAVVKSNIISAVEAVTGAATHKIQVFEMGE